MDCVKVLLNEIELAEDRTRKAENKVKELEQKLDCANTKINNTKYALYYYIDQCVYMRAISLNSGTVLRAFEEILIKIK